MASRKQIRANRRNARRSTGPKTAAGKAASAANALRHGLSAAETVVLPDEDLETFEQMQRGVLGDLDPKDTIQTVLAHRIVVLLWRLDRVARLEAELFVHGHLDWRRNRLDVASRRGALGGTLVRLEQDGHELAGAFKEAMDETNRLTDDIGEEVLWRAPSARTLVERKASGKAFDRLARHEGTLQRALHRTLEEFGCLRAAWKRAARDRDVGPSGGEDASPPWEADAPADDEAEAPAAQADDEAEATAAQAPAAARLEGQKSFLQNEANSAQPLDAAPFLPICLLSPTRRRPRRAARPRPTAPAPPPETRAAAPRRGRGGRGIGAVRAVVIP